jgi:hypothetical protein
MMSPDVRITRPSGGVTWRVITGGEVAGEAHAMLRPDRRWFVSADTRIAAAFSPLISAVAGDLRQDLYTILDEDDEEGLRDWETAGFTVVRREHNYLVPTVADRAMLAAAALPAGMSLVAADAVNEDGLRLLDEALRVALDLSHQCRASRGRRREGDGGCGRIPVLCHRGRRRPG